MRFFFFRGKNSFQVISNAVFIGYETLIATLNTRQSISTALAVVGFVLGGGFGSVQDEHGHPPQSVGYIYI